MIDESFQKEKVGLMIPNRSSQPRTVLVNCVWSVGFPVKSNTTSFIACTSIEIGSAEILKESDVDFIEIRTTNGTQFGR